MKKRLAAFAIIAVFTISAPAWPATYALDADHTTVGFKVRHILSWVQGTFNTFEGSFTYDPASPDTWKAEAVIQTASIDTGVEARDKHLRNPDFFEVEKFPAISFKSTSITDVTPTHAKLHGLLMIRDVEKEVVLDVEILGEVTDPWGNKLSAFTATTTINRKDFGLTWNKAVETGQLLVGEEVVITIEASGIMQG